MAEYHLKIKVGEHEFEADGPVEAVKSQFQMFKELIAGRPDHKPETTPPQEIEPPADVTASMNDPTSNLEKIFHQRGRVVSLTAPPTSATDAVLLTLYGQKKLRNNDAPTGGEILDGLEQSGYREVRIDKILMVLASEGAVIITGRHRGKRYRLTNQGFNRADGVVKDAIAKLP